MFVSQISRTKTTIVAVAISLLIGLGVRTGAADESGPILRKNPYAGVDWERVQPYLANFHSHTVYSDGRAEPEQLISNYAQAGYAILTIADHDNVYTHRAGEPDVEPTHQTTWPWTRWIDEEPATIWSRNGMETSAFFPDLGEHGMLAIRGNELSSHPHMVSLFNDCGFPDSRHSETERLDCVQTKGGLAYWAHPSLYVPPHGWQNRFFQSSFEQAIDYYSQYLAKYDALLGVEFNQNDLDARMPEPVKVFDALLQRLYKDHDVFVFGSDDTHATTVADNATLTIVLAEELTEPAIRHALQQGHTFVGQRTEVFPEFREITVDQDAMTISVDVANYDRIQWIRNGQEYGEGETIDYSDMRDTVLRFEVIAGDRRFYSQAFYVE